MFEKSQNLKIFWVCTLLSGKYGNYVLRSLRTLVPFGTPSFLISPKHVIRFELNIVKTIRKASQLNTDTDERVDVVPAKSKGELELVLYER